MMLAMREAEDARAAGEVPCGCVIVKDGVVIARGRNSVEHRKDATAHAEMLALAEAQAACGDWRCAGEPGSQSVVFLRRRQPDDEYSGDGDRQ